MTFLERVISKFSKKARSQELKGIKKYGHELQPMDDEWDWLEMAKEELVDAFKYMEAERERRDRIVKDIRFKLIGARNHCESAAALLYIKDVMEDLKKLERGEG